MGQATSQIYGTSVKRSFRLSPSSHEIYVRKKGAGGKAGRFGQVLNIAFILELVQSNSMAHMVT